jgi:hypothetical protein
MIEEHDLPIKTEYAVGRRMFNQIYAVFKESTLE